MDGIHTTTDPTILVHHESSCIDCGGETSEKPLPSASEAYECESCGVVVAEESGESVVRGEVSESTISSFSLV